MKGLDKKKPTLLVMAAGMGSRYGGLKQIDKITEEGEILLDFSLYDAKRAGFDRAVFVIREEHRDLFEEILENGAARHMEIDYAYQKLEDIPEGFSIPQGRKKPWGTAHAVWSARDLIDGPFAIVNGDDYYGPEAFKTMYEFLAKQEKPGDFAMVAYELKNTITENGHVSRGVCRLENGYLADIVERSKIMRLDGQIAYEDQGASWQPLAEDTPVSMNLWGYSPLILEEIGRRFPAFMEEALREDPLKAEYLIPKITDDLIKEGLATCKVLQTGDKWYGMTYPEDKAMVQEALKAKKQQGQYPEKLWT